jgi:SAM-dependent methyltransferase
MIFIKLSGGKNMKTSHKKEWFDDLAFWRDTYSLMFSEKRFSNAIEQIDQVLKLTKPKGQDVLDLACGPGRWAIPFAQRGYKVTGVDKTQYLLDKAKAKTKAARLKIEWIKQDMRDFVRPQAFDLVLNMFTSFGFFDNKREDITVLQNIFTSLRPGGVFLIDVASKEWLAKMYEPTNSDILPDGTLMVQRHNISDNWTRVDNEWIFIRKGKIRSHKFSHTIYSGQELKDRMEQVGFVDIHLYGNIAGDEYGTKAQRLIAVGHKPRK